jgi:trehalose 6-phosphate synthase
MTDFAEYLRGRTLILLSNREPYEHRHAEGGRVEVRQPPGGLVSALDPTMRATHGTWVAWGSGTADRETADAEGRVMVPPDNPMYALHRVFLEESDIEGYYLGFANGALWPLCHMLVQHFEFRDGDWDTYRAVNEKFAAAVAAEVNRAENPAIVWIQDYHFGLAAEMIRAGSTPALIHQFWHIPFPPSDILRLLPVGVDEALLRGMLGNDLIAFQTERSALNFVGCVAEFVPEAEIDADSLNVHYGGRQIVVANYPISIDVEKFERMAQSPESVARIKSQNFRLHAEGLHRRPHNEQRKGVPQYRHLHAGDARSLPRSP